MVDGGDTETVETAKSDAREGSGAPEAETRMFARIISGTDATVLERAVNAALAVIPLAAKPQVQLIAPLGDRVRLYALITYEATEADATIAKRATESPRRLSVNYETLK